MYIHISPKNEKTNKIFTQIKMMVSMGSPHHHHKLIMAEIGVNQSKIVPMEEK